jgi:hypothetical protein
VSGITGGLHTPHKRHTGSRAWTEIKQRPRPTGRNVYVFAHFGELVFTPQSELSDLVCLFWSASELAGMVHRSPYYQKSLKQVMMCERW